MAKKSKAPWPLIEMAIEPKSNADRERLEVALAKLASDDPAFLVTTDRETGLTIIKGMGVLHLDTKIDALKRAHKLDVNVGGPQVAYRETITKRVEVEYTHRQQADGKGQFARIRLVVEPNEIGKGFAFVSQMSDDTMPKDYVASVETGIHAVAAAGIHAGFPVVDVKVHLIDAAYHAADSSPLAFEAAARAALREALHKGGSVLLEPMMIVEVLTPEDCLGSVIGDLHARRGRIQEQYKRGGAFVIEAVVPLANLFGLENDFRGHTGGRATFTASYACYSRMLGPDDHQPPPAAASALRA